MKQITWWLIRAAVAAKVHRFMAEVSDEAVNRMMRLIGDADKAECKVNKLRCITSN
ncbi:MAG: Winged helix-turn-helix transcriptional regulator, partial [Euryarchaeota archaeon]|nr:Winged helix-turn-helix transcriptional regulator [Euryarchaeota archaeon]